MAPFNTEDAAFAGVGLLLRRPLAAFAWALVWAVFLVVVSAPFFGMAASLLSLTVRAQGHASSESVLPLIGGLAAWGLLVWVGTLAVGAVVQSAVIRAVLEPENAGGAYLRVSRRETFVLSANFVKSLILLGVSILVITATGIGEIALTAAGRGAVAVIHLIGELVNLVVAIWIGLRFALAAPMSWTERRFRLFESWTLTRGMGWRLMAVAVIVAVMVFAVYLVAACATVGGSLVLWRGGPRPAELTNLLSLPPAQWEIVFAPFFVLAGAVSVIAGALITPIALAPWPTIYRTLAARAETDTGTETAPA